MHIKLDLTGAEFKHAYISSHLHRPPTLNMIALAYVSYRFIALNAALPNRWNKANKWRNPWTHSEPFFSFQKKSHILETFELFLWL